MSRTPLFTGIGEDGEDKTPKREDDFLQGVGGEALQINDLRPVREDGEHGEDNSDLHTCARVRGVWGDASSICRSAETAAGKDLLHVRVKISSLSSPSSLNGVQPTEKTWKRIGEVLQNILPETEVILPILPDVKRVDQGMVEADSKTTRY